MNQKKKILIVMSVIIGIVAAFFIILFVTNQQEEKVNTDVIKGITQTTPKEEKEEVIDNTYYTAEEYKALPVAEKNKILEYNEKVLKQSGKKSFCGKANSEDIMIRIMNKLTLGLVTDAKDIFDDTSCLPDGLNPDTFRDDMSLLNDYINNDNADKRINYLTKLSNKVSLASFVPAAGALYSSRVVDNIKSEIPVFDGNMEIESITRLDDEQSADISNQFGIDLKNNFIIAINFIIEDVSETKNGDLYEKQSWVAYIASNKTEHTDKLLVFKNLDVNKEYNTAAFWNDYYQEFRK